MSNLLSKSVVASLLASGAFALPAAADEPQIGGQAQASTQSVSLNRSQPADGVVKNFWVCATGVQLQAAPVSYDEAENQGEAPEAWVVVYRQNDEVVASERISAEDARNMPSSYDCETGPLAGKGERKDAPSSLIG
jgi:hypothetical protein